MELKLSEYSADVPLIASLCIYSQHTCYSLQIGLNLHKLQLACPYKGSEIKKLRSNCATSTAQSGLPVPAECGEKDMSGYGSTQQKHYSASQVVQIPFKLSALTSSLHREITSCTILK